MRRLCLLVALPALALAVYDIPSVELNAWTCTFSNYGTWGYGNPNAGGSWLGNPYIYGAGIWVGCVTAAGETLVTAGYNPNSGASEMFPTLTQYWREDTGDTRDRVYVYPGDWPAPPDRFPMAPTAAEADVEAWSCCCDSAPARHNPPGLPIGFDLCTTILADTDAAAQNFFFLRCAIANPSAESLADLFVGICCDPDVGNAVDDRAGLILDRVFVSGADTFHIRNTGFAWSQDQTPPGAVAVRYLSGPLGDTITAFKLFYLANDPTTDAKQYMALAGYDWNTGEYAPFDSIDPLPDDKRFLIAAGPFAVAPHETATCWFAVIGAQFTPGDTTELARTADAAFRRWQRLLGVAEQPAAPMPHAYVYPRLLRPGMSLHIEAHDRPVRVCDTRGALVMTLTGRDITWNGTGPDGRLLPAGVYLVGTVGRNMTKVILLRD